MAGQSIARDVFDMIAGPTFDAVPAALHFFDSGPLTAQYLLVIDSLSFWPESGLEYEHLARGLKIRLPTG